MFNDILADTTAGTFRRNRKPVRAPSERATTLRHHASDRLKLPPRYAGPLPCSSIHAAVHCHDFYLTSELNSRQTSIKRRRK